MNNKKVVVGVMIFSMVLISISLISAGWFSDLFTFGSEEDLEGELPTAHGKEVNLTVFGAPQEPEIVFISDLGYAETAPLPADPNRTLVEDASVQRDFEFHAWSVAGVEALPGTSVAVTDANALLTLRDVVNAPNRERKSSDPDPNAVTCVYDRDSVAPAGAFASGVIPNYPGPGALVRVYRCSVAMQYYDDYGAVNWEVRAYVMDNYNTEEGYKTDSTMIDNAQAIPLRVTYFNKLDSSALVPVGGAMEFGTVSYGLQTTQPGDIGGIYPLTIRNTGNSDINPVRVQGEDVPGLTTNTDYILASWFSVSEDGSNPCAGTSLVDGSLIDSGMAQINNGPGASDGLRTCLTDVQATASIQAYSTTESVNGVLWVIDTTFAFILSISKFFRINFGISLLVVSVIIRNKKEKSKKRKKKYNLSEDDLLVLNNKLKEKYNIGIEELLEISEKKEHEDELEVQIPINIFNQQISPAEALCKYLKENLGLNFRNIAKLINRDERTVWINYRNSVKKKKEKIKIEKKTVEKEIEISIKIFSDRRLSILESVVNYLKKKEFRNSEISEMLGKDQRNISTLYSRVRRKLE